MNNNINNQDKNKNKRNFWSLQPIEVCVYRDGGTTEYETSDGAHYFIDDRLNSPTQGQIFDKYPGNKDAKIVDNLYLGHYKMPAPTKG